LRNVAIARVIRMRIGRQKPERYILMRRPLDLPAAHHTQAVTIHQQPDHHRRLVSRQAPPIAFVGLVDRLQIQFLHHIGDETRQVSLRQPVVQRWRQQQGLIQVVSSEALAHSHILRPDLPALKTFLI
jgi:hypothetical protein